MNEIDIRFDALEIERLMIELLDIEKKMKELDKQYREKRNEFYKLLTRKMRSND